MAIRRRQLNSARVVESRKRTPVKEPARANPVTTAKPVLNGTAPTPVGEQTQYVRGKGGAELPAPGHPALLTGRQRKKHIVQLLLNDHAQSLVNAADAVETKFDKLEQSPFVFFRGTAALFFRDLAGLDKTATTLLVNGDVHPENFGISEIDGGKLQFSVNDFDESTQGPFTFDVRRGAVGFDLVARQSGLSKKARTKIVKAFVDGYVDGLKDFAKDDSEFEPVFVKKGSPDVITDAFKLAEDKTRKDLLKRFCKDGAFKKSRDIAPVSERIPEFQAALNAVRDSRNLRMVPAHNANGLDMTVKDVAIKSNSGTGALDRERYYVLVEGLTPSADDDLILEFKEEGQSVLDRQAPMTPLDTRLFGAHRVVDAQRTQVVGADGLSGHTRLGAKSFLVRERNPHKTSVDVGSLSKDDLMDYAAACGNAVAHAHARSDETMRKTGQNIEAQILRSLDGTDFEDEMASWADDYGDKVVEDHKLFCAARKAKDL